MDTTARPRPGPPRLAGWILAGGALASIVAFALSRQSQYQQALSRFDDAVNEAHQRLHERLRSSEDLLRGIRGFVQAGARLDRASFRSFAASMGVDHRHAGLLGVSYGVPLAPRGEAALLARLAAEHGNVGLAIHPGTGFEGDTVVLFAEPEDANRGALGFNSASSDEQRGSLLEARDSGEPRVSGPMATAQAPEAGPGIVLRLAIYDAPRVPDTLEERRRTYAGCANAVFLLARLADSATVRLAESGVRVRMSDVTDAEDAAPFLDGGGSAPRRWWHAAVPDGLERHVGMNVAGRRWSLDFTAGPSFFEATEALAPPAVGLAGLLITVLLSALVGSISRTGERARDLADRMTESLRVSESRLQAVVRVIPDLILVLDRDGRYREVHTGDPSTLVAPAEALLGRTLAEVLPADVAERLLAAVRRALDEAEIVSVEYAVQTQRGPLHFDARVAPTGLDIEGQPCAILVARDVTERHAREEAHVQAQKLEGLGLLAGGIAHDVNNLLAAIQGNLALGRLALAAGRDAVPNLDRADAGVRRAADLARQLLAYSGKASFRLENLDLNRVVGEMGELLSVSRPRKVELDVSLEPGLPPIRGDRAQVQQVVMNLVTNAAEAIGNESGLVTLATSSGRLDAAAIAQRMPGQVLAPGPCVTLTVTDTGCGMTDDVQSRIFDPFFTTKPTGRGLGLSALRGILRSHGAGIEIRTRPGEGSTFRIHFPLAPAEAHASGERRPPPPPSPLPEGATLLVVDDEPMLRGTSRAMAEHLGFRVVEAADGEEAWALLRDRRDGLCCVLLDLTMPRMGGAELYRRVREVAPRFPLVLCSGYSREALPSPMDPDEPTVFLQKPFSLEQMDAALRQALAGAG